VSILDPWHSLALDLTELYFPTPFNSLLSTAIVAGKTLAYMLGSLNMFSTCCVTLVGYSTGSIVVYNALSDLLERQKKDIVFNVMMIGGLLSKHMLNLGLLKNFAGNFYNVFSANDRVLKYISNTNSMLMDPVGCTDIQSDIMTKKKINTYNLDLSKSVTRH
jgi:hypothetical protein